MNRFSEEPSTWPQPKVDPDKPLYDEPSYEQRLINSIQTLEELNNEPTSPIL